MSIRYYTSRWRCRGGGSWVLSLSLSIAPEERKEIRLPAASDLKRAPTMRMLSYQNATIALCFFNLVATLFILLRGHASLSHRRISASSHRLSSAQLKYLWESEELRRVMEPVDLIKRIKEIEQEVYADAEVETENAPKQTAAVDLSKRLQDMRAVNEANSQKALEEWRKRKIERARQREIGKNGTTSGSKS